MDITELINGGAVILTAYGGLALSKYHGYRSLITRAELIMQFEDAMEKQKKYASTELFRMLHGLQLSYEDIRAIVQDDRVAHILKALSKTPNRVTYESGRFQYKGAFSNPKFRNINKLITRGFATVFGLFFILLLVISVVSTPVARIVLGVLLVPAAAMLAMQLRDLRYDQMIEELVVADESASLVPEKSNQNSAAE